MEQNDLELVEAAKLNPEAFQAIYDKFRRKVFEYFWYRVGQNDQVAEDLMQETFLRAFSALQSFEIRDRSYRAYLFTIAHNILVSHFRKKRVEPLEAAERISTDPRERLDVRLDATKVWQDAERLPTSERDALIFRYMHRLRFAEIGRIMQRSENAIRLLVSRALRKLRQYIDRPVRLIQRGARRPRAKQNPNKATSR